MGSKPYMRRSGPDLKAPDGKEIKPYAFMHPCCVEGCEKHGGFGYKVNLRRNQPGQWYCADHRHIGEALYHPSTNTGHHEAAKETPHEQPALDLGTDGS